MSWEMLDTAWAVIFGLATAIALSYLILSSKIAKVHERIDQVKDDYVRRDDLAVHLKPLQDGLTRLDEKLDRLINRRTRN